MSFGVIAAVVSVASFVYSTYTSIQAAKAQKRAAEKAAKAADAAKGFQLTADGEAKPIGVTFGRAKIGGTRVAYAVKSSYTYAPLPSIATLFGDDIELVPKTSYAGAIDISYPDITCTSTHSDVLWDSFAFSGQKFHKNMKIRFRIKANSTGKVGFASSNSPAFSSLRHYIYFSNGNYTFSSGSVSGTYGNAVFEISRDANGLITFSVNDNVLASLYDSSDYYLGFMFATKDSGITILNLEGGTASTSHLFANYKPEGAIDCWELVNTKEDWTGTWSIVKRSSNLSGNFYVTRSKPNAWTKFSNKVATETYGFGGNGPTFTFTAVVPSVDYLFVSAKIVRYDTHSSYVNGHYVTTTTPVYDYSAKPPTLAQLGFSFPEYIVGTSNRLASNISGEKREFLLFQQVIGFSGMNAVISAEVNEQPYNYAAYTPGLMLYYYKDGGVVCPLMAANDASRAESRFVGTAYFTGAFKLNRDDPQFSGIPDVVTYVEGQVCRDIIYDASTGVYSESSWKTYTTNPARILLEYLRDSQFGRGLSSSQIHYKSFFEATQICGRIVISNAAKEGTYWQAKSSQRDIPMFEFCATLDTSAKFRDNIETILGSMYMADLLWSGGQYKLQFQYPRIYSNSTEYGMSEIVQRTIASKQRLFRSKGNDNIGHTPESSPSFWAEDVLVLEISDDDLILDSEVQIEWPSIDSKLNFATVRFLNEDLDFAEDVVSWPDKEPKSQFDTVYATYLAEDNGRALESEFFETGITTIFHAKAAAEQRVRYSRHEITYTFKITLVGIELEPGDLIGFESQTFGIGHCILKVTSFDSEAGGIITISAIRYDANMLAWNVADTVVEHVALETVYNALDQATELEISTGNTTNKQSFYRLMWTPASADTRVVRYAIKYTTDSAANISTATTWTTLAVVQGRFYDLPAFEGSYTFTVVSMDAKGKEAPYISNEEHSCWSFIEYDFAAKYTLSTAANVKFKGRTSLVEQTNGLPDVTAISVTVETSAGEIVNNLQYRWYDVTSTPFAIDQTATDWQYRYGFRSYLDADAGANATFAELGVNVPADGTIYQDSGKAIVLSSDALNTVSTFRVDVLDQFTKLYYTGYLTVTDATAPHAVSVVSQIGNTFRNGQGSTVLQPSVFCGTRELTDLKGWQFVYSLKDKDGKNSGFVDLSRLSEPATITSNSFGYDSFQLVLNKEIPCAVGDVIKIVPSDISTRTYRVSYVNGANISLAATDKWPIGTVSLNELVGSLVYLCTAGTDDYAGSKVVNGLTALTKTKPEDFSVTLSAIDVNLRAQVLLMAFRPTLKDLKSFGILP